MTIKRKTILDLLNQSDKPLLAKVIHKKLPLDMNLSTVYRALEYLEKNNLISSAIFFENNRFFWSKKKDHHHFIYCQGCGEIHEFDDCVASAIQEKIQKKYQFEINDHFLLFRGKCRHCV
mgnify:CR=1 FL=1